MPVKTRKQQFLIDAVDLVSQVIPESGPDGEFSARATKIRDMYGGLCHSFPIMIRNEGLAQTIAWVEEKSSEYRRKDNKDEVSERAWAYHHLRNHIAATLGMDDADGLVGAVHEASMNDYLRYTSTLLAAWVYHKRFAVSLLHVESASEES